MPLHNAISKPANSMHGLVLVEAENTDDSFFDSRDVIVPCGYAVFTSVEETGEEKDSARNTCLIQSKVRYKSSGLLPFQLNTQIYGSDQEWKHKLQRR